MSGRIQVTPGRISRSAAGVTTVIALLFLVFGVVFFWVVMTDTPSSEQGLQLLQAAFLAVWVIACLAIAFLNLRIYFGAKNPADASLLQLEGDAGFDARLRKLEGLRRDGLVSEEEYQRKRAEILGEKW